MIFYSLPTLCFFWGNGFSQQALIYVHTSYQGEETSEDLFVFPFLLKVREILFNLLPFQITVGVILLGYS